MSARSRSARLAWWLAIGVLLLKSAVPMVAVGAAHLRGVGVAAVCPVYGVALPAALSGAGDRHGSHDRTTHGHAAHADHVAHDGGASGDPDEDAPALALHDGDHCALTALAALATGAATGQPFAGTQRGAGPAVVPRAIVNEDASAAWMARLEHGPPLLT
ncbi:hypothetical protein [Piscinibacter koreensis]|uniref:Uncharacterized protein n=1 Tax=Piscinibacter koreensis TaxID=2742824 RepID=A0A7Y6NP67_9BURK|nr:hypothetical protein [Schlegelella koreensis]NUZ06805.1 hypothetical protein [Schlegelella koreensis]